jgi:hypothetical protein
MSQPLMLHPENPHYFAYKGRPAVLITSAMHYGAVLNLDINYDKYLDLLESYGFNMHREFIIPCYELSEGNNPIARQSPLYPRKGKLLSPYARSLTPGGADSLNRFDLDKWNPVYFEHLKDFCRKADEKGIIVEITLFTVLYSEEAWKTHPFNLNNNINNVGKGRYNDFTFIGEPGLLERQKDLVRKVVTELKDFDNVYFEICNEPYWARGVPENNPEIKEQHFLPEVNKWQAMIGETITETEKDFPKKHLIAQNFANTYYKIDTMCMPAVNVLNFHYSFPPRVVPDNYQFQLPLGFDETAGGCDAPDRRIEAWAFIMAGGAVYDNLDWSFAIDDQTGLGRNPTGRRRSGVEVKQQLSVLKKFTYSFDFIHSVPVSPGRILNLPDKVLYFGLENKKSTAIYFLKRSVVDVPGAIFEIDPGNYTLTWTDPLDGSVIRSVPLTAKENKTRIDFPAFTDDLLMILVKK